LAKSLDDPGGLGPYRSVTPAPNLDRLRATPGQLLHTLAARAKARLVRLDAWLSWPLVILALVGTRSDPPLARRDLILGATATAPLLAFSPEVRVLLPLLPLAAIWTGAGAAALSHRVAWWVWPLLAWLAWFVPIGAAMRPGAELAATPMQRLEPATVFVAAVAARAEPEPYFTDSSALAYRAGRQAVFVPDTPQTLQWLRQRAALRGASLVALSEGTSSSWFKAHAAAWEPWFAASETLYAGPDGALLLRLPQRLCSLLELGPGHELRPDEVPSDLVEVPAAVALREGIQLRAECWENLRRLLAAAAADGIELRVASGYRPFAQQQVLHASAQRRHGESQRWVAAAGQSEHQLGDAVDLSDAAQAHLLVQSFAETAEGRWLAANARRFEFRLSYTAANQRVTGIAAEPWHIRFVGGDRCRPPS
jgi:D-alanyl-D-alanine carboxypeptidase